MIGELRGLDKLVRTMNRLKDKTAAKAARAGIRAGLAVLNKDIRRAVNDSTVASPELKRAARVAIGTRLLKSAEANAKIAGKGGFGVGFRGKKKRLAAALRVAKRKASRAAKGKKPGGVGLDASNIHWFVLGTAERETGSKMTRVFQRDYLRGQQKPGPGHWSGDVYTYTSRPKARYYIKETGNPVRRTGRVPPILAGIMEAAARSAGPAMIQAMRDKVQQVIASEVHSSQVPNLNQ